MAKKSFKDSTPLDNLVGASAAGSSDQKNNTDNDNHSAAGQDSTSAAGQDKRKVGRPKTKDVKGTCKNINVAIPIVLLDQWEDIKIVHGSNLTAYVTKLIAKDMEDNYKKYKALADSLSNL